MFNRLLTAGKVDAQGRSLILLCIIRNCSWAEIRTLLVVSRGMREYAAFVYSRLYTSLVNSFFPTYADTFSDHLIASRGGLAGSCGYSIALPDVRVAKTNLNVVVPIGHTGPVFAFLHMLSWLEWDGGVDPVWKQTALSHTCFDKCVNGEDLRVTVTETSSYDIVQHVMCAKHTAATAILSPTALTFLHSPSPLTYVRETDNRLVLAHRLHKRGLQVHLVGGPMVANGFPTVPTIQGIVWARPHWVEAKRDVYGEALQNKLLGAVYFVRNNV